LSSLPTKILQSSIINRASSITDKAPKMATTAYVAASTFVGSTELGLNPSDTPCVEPHESPKREKIDDFPESWAASRCGMSPSLRAKPVDM